MAKDEEEGPKEYKRPDAAKAFQIYDRYIAPNLAKISELSGDNSPHWKDIKKFANYPRPVMNFLIALGNIDDDAKRDHYLLALAEGLKHRQFFLPRDLVTMASGEDGDEIVPTGDREAGGLATLDDDDDAFDEADEEELAAQVGRSKAKAGTGAAAIEAMKKSAAEASAATH